MAYIAPVDASSAVNVPVLAGMDIYDVGRYGNRIKYQVRGWITMASDVYSLNTWALWVAGRQFNVKGRERSYQGTYYYTDWVPYDYELSPVASEDYISLGVSGINWNPTEPAGWFNLKIEQLPIAYKPVAGNVQISEITDKSFRVRFSDVQSINAPIERRWIGLFSDAQFKTRIQESYSNDHVFNNLDPNRPYYIQVQNYNVIGWSDYVPASTLTLYYNPKAPTSVITGYSEPEPIPKAKPTYSISGANNGSLTIQGYKLNLYKGSDIIFNVDIPANSSNGTLNFKLEDKGYTVGDTYYIGVQSYEVDWNGTKHYSNEVLSNSITLISDKFIQISVNGTAFEKRKIYISIKGSNFIEVKKEMLKILR